MLGSGALQRHKNEVLIPTYRVRHNAMISAIRKYLYPLGVRIVADGGKGPVGGYFLYILFPADGPDVEDIIAVALGQFNLRIQPGKIFGVIDDTSESNLRPTTYARGARLCWAWEEADTLVKGIQRLAEVLKLLVKNV
jgi:DNA-binding transcriptional MocR family regulator